VASLVHGVVENLAEVDEQITKHAEHWRMERMPAVDRNILRLAVYEMSRGGAPAPVAIDEALELARKFSGEESVQFVNGVLDAVNRDLQKGRAGA
jgi:N utilization substance protein B